MALDVKPEHIAIAGGAAIVGAYLLSRSGGGTTFIQTGPSEATARELIRAGVESQSIEAERQVSLADVFTSGEVALSKIASEERIAFEQTRSLERVAIHRDTTTESIAKIVTEPAKIQAQAQASAVAAQAQHSFLQDLLDIGGFIAGLFGL